MHMNSHSNNMEIKEGSAWYSTSTTFGREFYLNFIADGQTLASTIQQKPLYKMN